MDMFGQIGWSTAAMAWFRAIRYGVSELDNS
jgi:hypothetical protein